MPLTIAPLPVPVPSSTDPGSFSQRGDATFGAFPNLITETNALASEQAANRDIVIQNRIDTETAQASAANFALAASVSEANSLASSSAQLWVSGTTYSVGTVVYSPITASTYRRKTAGAGTTDPSADSTNWYPVVLDANTNYPLIQPTLNLDFANRKSLDPRITFTRNSVGTYFDSKGVLQTAQANVARFDHDPVTGESLGLLIEESRTNTLLNSATLSTQTVTTSATAYTLSFYGTGSVVLSGTATGTLVGTGEYPSRSTLTFTATAGSLTLTVTGTVQYAQLESGSFATSYIPTTSTAVTRQADVASITGTNFSDWYRQDEGTLYGAGAVPVTTQPGQRLFAYAFNAASNNGIGTGYGAAVFNGIVVDGAVQANIQGGVYSANTENKTALAYRANDFSLAANASSIGADTAGSVPAVDSLAIGRYTPAGNIVNGHIKKIAYYPKRLTNQELQAITS